MLNAAIVGLGRWGQNLVNAAQGKSEKLRFVRGVVRHPDKVQAFGAQHGFEIVADYAAMLADPTIEAVVLATPHSTHVDQIVAAAAAGKHVYCEKPLTLKHADAARAIAACEKAGVTLAVGYDKRFWPSTRELARIIASGDLGEILYIEGHNSNESTRNAPAPWRTLQTETPGAGMTGTGVHTLDAMIGLVGAVKRVQVQRKVQREAPVLDSTAVVMEFANGIGGTLATLRATPSFWRIHVFGDKASAEAIGANEVVVRRSGAAPQRVALEPVDALRAELEAFADAVAGRASYPVTREQMLDGVAAFEAIVQSMESGQPVDLM